jgi:O-antigen/teichoic acid export membrane protein
LKILNKINLAAAQYPGFKKYFYNTTWMFAEKGLRLIAGLFVGAFVARYLEPGPFGLLNYAISLVSLFSALSALGLDQIVVRELIKNKSELNKVLGTVFVLRVIGVLLVMLCLTIFIIISETEYNTSVIIYVVAVGMFFEGFSVIDFYFQSQVQSKYVVWSQMISLTCLSIFRIVLIYTEAPLVWFALAYSLDFLVLAIGLLFFYSRNYNIVNWFFDFRKAKALLKQSWPLIIGGLSVGVYVRIDQIMIKWMLGNEASGNYGVAVRLSELWYFIPVAICGSVFPSIINSKMVDEILYQKRLQMLYDLMVSISVFVAILMTLFSDFIVGMLYGSAYSEASSILVIYIWSGVFVFLGVANGKRFVSENLLVFQMIGTAIAALMNIVLNCILIKSTGLKGAAYATLISYSFSGYFILLFLKRTRPMFIDSTKSLNIISVIRRLVKGLNY